MKLMNYKSMLLLVLAAFSITASSQTAYKGQLYITDEAFHHEGDLLHVRMKVSYNDDAVPSGESLILTPVLKCDTLYRRLSSVVIDGDRQKKTLHRAEALQGYRRSNVAVVVKDRKAGRRYFVYDTSVPYEYWMKGSSLYTESEEQNGKSAHPHVYEDRVLTSIPFDNEPVSVTDSRITSSQLMVWVQLIDPSGTDCDIIRHSGVIPFTTREMAMSGERRNELVYETIANDIKNALQQYGTSLQSARLTGYGVPTGNHRANEKGAFEKALSLRQYLMGHTLTATNRLDVSWIAEDWDSIQVLTAQSEMDLKDAALDIMRSVAVNNGREKVLQNLYSGIPYNYMRTVIFPKVNRVAYTLVYNRKGVDAATGRLMMKQNPHTMTLTDFWNVSQSYAPGSREYNDVIDLSARIFHDNPIANINAAAVAITRNDTKTARQYLNGLDTDPRAYNNLGLLYMLEGNTDKAEVYLRMAQAAGVKQSTDILKHLRQ